MQLSMQGLWLRAILPCVGVPFGHSFLMRLPNQKCVDAKALLWGVNFTFNIRFNEAHLFGDNAVALIQFFGCKVWVGPRYRQTWLKSFRYPWASCLGFSVY